jgi:twitching motility protein PilT
MDEQQPQPTEPQEPEDSNEIHQSQYIEVVGDNAVHTLDHVDNYLRVGQESDASDIHLAVNVKPTWRRYGNLECIWMQADVLTAADTERLAMGFLNDAQKKRLRDKGDVDFAYATSLGRFRASVVRHRLGIDIVFRIIKTNVRTMDELGLPETLKRLTQYHNGLILVTGSVGSGKSTTLAAMVDYISLTRHDHIITLEDPIEYVIPSKNCHVTQREVHTHTKSFAAALRGALREDPDVIMVGEMRDLETIQLAITASETGHLVLATLHTGSAARTLDRVLDVFPVDQRDQIRVMVSESLRGIVSQQLVPKQDGRGRALALEILLRTEAVAACIRKGETFMLPGIMQTGGKMGMKLMDDSLYDLWADNQITPEEAYTRCDQKVNMRQRLMGEPT